MSAQHAGVSRCPARVHIADLSLTGDDCRDFPSSYTYIIRLQKPPNTRKGAADTCSGVRLPLRWLFLNRLDFLPHSQALHSKGPRISPAMVHCCDRQPCVLTDTCAPVYPPSVVASASYCALSASASDAASMFFLSGKQNCLLTARGQYG